MAPKIVFCILSLFLYVNSINADCVLNMKEDLTLSAPLVLSAHAPKWVPTRDSPKGTVSIDKDEVVRLACKPDKQSNVFFKHNNLKSNNVVTAKCKGGKSFEISGTAYNFQDLMCDSPLVINEHATGKECLGKDTELYKVGFQVGNDFITEYEACFEKKEKFTLYTEVTIPGDIDKSTLIQREHGWFPKKYDIFRQINMEDTYKCGNQADTFKRILNKEYFENNKCCLEKGKLVGEDNMMYAVEQASTSHYLNVVPQWSTCNRVNWKHVEKRVRDLAISLKRPLTVWTGTYRKMTLAAKWGFSHKDMYMHYNSNSDKAIPVPLYIWKVVYDPQSQKALAIVEINNPHLLLTDIDSLVLCEDVCKNVHWMNFLERKTTRDGYVFCCHLSDFEFGFAFKKSPFPRASGLLRDERR